MNPSNDDGGEVYFHLLRPVIVKGLQQADVYQFHIGYQPTVEFGAIQTMGIVVSFDDGKRFIAMEIDAKMITNPMNRKYEALIVDHIITRIKAARTDRPI